MTIYGIQTVVTISLSLSLSLSQSDTLFQALLIANNKKKLYKVFAFCLLLAIFKWHCHSAQK